MRESLPSRSIPLIPSWVSSVCTGRKVDPARCQWSRVSVNDQVLPTTPVKCREPTWREHGNQSARDNMESRRARACGEGSSREPKHRGDGASAGARRPVAAKYRREWRWCQDSFLPEAGKPEPRGDRPEAFAPRGGDPEAPLRSPSGERRRTAAGSNADHRGSRSRLSPTRTRTRRRTSTARRRDACRCRR